MEGFENVSEDTSSASCRGMVKRRKRQKSDSGHLVKSLYERAMI